MHYAQQWPISQIKTEILPNSLRYLPKLIWHKTVKFGKCLLYELIVSQCRHETYGYIHSGSKIGLPL